MTNDQTDPAPDLSNLVVRIDNSADWAEVEEDGVVIRRCHADSELIDVLMDILEEFGAITEWTTVTGPRI
jgi:hypothetical protein